MKTLSLKIMAVKLFPQSEGLISNEEAEKALDQIGKRTEFISIEYELYDLVVRRSKILSIEVKGSTRLINRPSRLSGSSLCEFKIYYDNGDSVKIPIPRDHASTLKQKFIDCTKDFFTILSNGSQYTIRRLDAVYFLIDHAERAKGYVIGVNGPPT